MRRIVVTGLGTINPLGYSVDEFWTNLLAGRTACQKIKRFDPDNFKTQIACELDLQRLSDRLRSAEIKRADLYTQFALYASIEAIEDSGLELADLDPYSVGVIWGTGQGGLTTIEEELKEYYQKEKKPHFHPLFIPKMLGSMAAGQVALKHQIKGVVYSNHAACASANAALMDAALLIKSGKSDVMLVGASDAPINEATIAGFNALRALSTKNQDPAGASRPFDENRDGFVVAEGGACLVLEAYEHAKERGANIYAELVGSSVTNDAYHITANHPEGHSAKVAIENALKEAKVNAEEIDYINPHATSTPVGDKAELHLLRTIWKNESPYISATKSMTGHHLGASGAIEAIICLKAISSQQIPATINITEQMEAWPKNFKLLTEESISTQIKYALNNSFGFGGHNAISIFKSI